MLGLVLIIAGVVGIVVAIIYYAKLQKKMDYVQEDHFLKELDSIHGNRVARIETEMNNPILIGLLAFIFLIAGLVIWF